MTRKARMTRPMLKPVIFWRSSTALTSTTASLIVPSPLAFEFSSAAEASAERTRRSTDGQSEEWANRGGARKRDRNVKPLPQGFWTWLPRSVALARRLEHHPFGNRHSSPIGSGTGFVRINARAMRKLSDDHHRFPG